VVVIVAVGCVCIISQGDCLLSPCKMPYALPVWSAFVHAQTKIFLAHNLHHRVIWVTANRSQRVRGPAYVSWMDVCCLGFLKFKISTIRMVENAALCYQAKFLCNSLYVYVSGGITAY